MNYKVIDVNTWNRKKQYDWFKTFDNPCFGINCKIDVTNVVTYSKQTKTSFFINFLYVVMISLNSVEELRLRIVNGEVRLYDNIDPTYTVMTESGVFENAAHKMSNDYETFYKRCHEVVEKVKKQTQVVDGYNDSEYGVYYITCLPWLSYESMTHPLPSNNPESSSCPRICWGKYELENDRYVLSFNLTVSHVLVDGFPVSKALNKLKELAMNTFKK